MKKFFRTINFIGKALFLLVILIFSWAFINGMNLFKGKSDSNSDSKSKLLGINNANAEDPPPDCWSYCPHVAYFNGTNYKIENDFLNGSPAYFSVDRAMAPALRQVPVRPDMIKFRQSPQKRDGVLALQLQENEEEESFVDWVRLIRVIHPKKSSVIVDSGFDSFRVFDKELAQKSIHLPDIVLQNGVNIASSIRTHEWLWSDPRQGEDPIVQKNDRMEFVFGGLRFGVAPALVMKSTFRDWMIGEENIEAAKKTLAAYIPVSILRAVPAILLVFAYFILERKSASGFFAFAPFLINSAAQSKSIVVSYKSEGGVYRVATVNKPRAWAYGTEHVALPKEAIWKDGSVHLKADFTKRHKLAFVGILQGMKESSYRTEELPVVRAVSSRLGDVSAKLSRGSREYAHMIPGDAIDVFFADEKLKLKKDEAETYLMQSMGFYSPLSKKSKKLAGNWKERISPEARAFTESLVKLSEYR